MLSENLKNQLHIALLGFLAISLVTSLLISSHPEDAYLPNFFKQFASMAFCLMQWDVLNATTRTPNVSLTSFEDWKIQSVITPDPIVWLYAASAILMLALIAHLSFAKENDSYFKSLASMLFGAMWFNAIFVSLISPNFEEPWMMRIIFDSYWINAIAGVYFLFVIKDFRFFNTMNNQKIIAFTAITAHFYFAMSNSIVGILAIFFTERNLHGISLSEFLILKFCVLLIFATIAMLLVDIFSGWIPKN